MTRSTTGLADPASKRGRGQRAILDLLDEHHAEGGLPTNGRFVFYELEQRGMACKPSPDDLRTNRNRSNGWPPGQQDITDYLTDLRDFGEIPWSWIIDEERRLTTWAHRLTTWAHAPSVAAYLRDRLTEATVSPWGEEPPPLIVTESKATAGVLEPRVAPYCSPVTGTKGQARGYLITEVAPLLAGNDRPVLYLGDLDKAGEDIEWNTRQVLEVASGRPRDWTRLAMTEELADAHGILPIWKTDGRVRPNGDGTRPGHWAIEVESLGQAALVDLVLAELDRMLPEPLAVVQTREDRERAELRELLDGTHR
jgi:hypothetical protein